MTPTPPKAPPPSEDRLKALIANGAQDVAQQLIDVHKLPFKIVEGKLADTVLGTELWLKQFITSDPEMIRMKQDIMRIAKVDDEVLITGETGTGKELIARAMIGDRKGMFLSINCAGLPENLIESELFGHTQGAFTDAKTTKKGMAQAAENGVLFLDEIGELPLHVQGKLLRAIQNRKVRKVGGTVEEDINCKFVCATNRNIKQMVDAGLFRQDLYARISTFELHIKPLRERKGDVELICNSIEFGAAFFKDNRADIINDKLDLSLNVRSILRYIRRYRVLGRAL